MPTLQDGASRFVAVLSGAPCIELRDAGCSVEEEVSCAYSDSKGMVNTTRYEFVTVGR